MAEGVGFPRYRALGSYVSEFEGWLRGHATSKLLQSSGVFSRYSLGLRPPAPEGILLAQQ